MPVYKAYKFRLSPSKEQSHYLIKHLQVNRRLYNTLLRATLSKFHQEASEKLLEYLKHHGSPKKGFESALLSFLESYRLSPYVEIKGEQVEVSFLDYLDNQIELQRKAHYRQPKSGDIPFQSVFYQSDWQRFKKQVTKGAKGYSKFELGKLVTQWVNDPQMEWISKKWNGEALRMMANQVDSAYKNFFNGHGYPKFKKNFDAVSLTFRRDNKEKQKLLLDKSNLSRDTSQSGNIRFEGGYIRLPTIGRIKVIKHRPVIGIILSATVSHQPDGNWFVSVLVSQEETELFPSVNRQVAIDIDSEGQVILYEKSEIKYCSLSPQALSAHQEQRLFAFEKTMSRQQVQAKQAGIPLGTCRNYQKSKLKVAKYHSKQARRRDYELQVFSKRLVERYDVLILSPQLAHLWRLKTLISQKAIKHGRIVVEVESQEEFLRLSRAEGTDK